MPQKYAKSITFYVIFTVLGIEIEEFCVILHKKFLCFTDSKHTIKIMRIGHQLFEFLLDFTDTGSYCVDDTTTFADANGRILCIREMYINDEERQVYLILEDETQNQFHVSINRFIKLMGGPKADSYAPLYRLRDEVQKVKKAYIKSYSNALKKYDPEERKLVKRIFKKLKTDESN